jgi:hypothetical protein
MTDRNGTGTTVKQTNMTARNGTGTTVKKQITIPISHVCFFTVVPVPFLAVMCFFFIVVPVPALQ